MASEDRLILDKWAKKGKKGAKNSDIHITTSGKVLNKFTERCCFHQRTCSWTFVPSSLVMSAEPTVSGLIPDDPVIFQMHVWGVCVCVCVCVTFLLMCVHHCVSVWLSSLFGCEVKFKGQVWNTHLSTANICVCVCVCVCVFSGTGSVNKHTPRWWHGNHLCGRWLPWWPRGPYSLPVVSVFPSYLFISLFLSFSLVKEERGSYFPVALILDQISLISNTPFAAYHTHKHTHIQTCRRNRKNKQT